MRRIYALLVVGVVLAFAGSWVNSSLASRDAAAHAALKAQSNLTKAANARAILAEQADARSKIRVAALEAERDAAIRDANAAGELLHTLVVPDTCVTIYETAILVENALTLALEKEQTAHAETKVARDTLAAALRDLRTASTGLVTAVDALPRPSLWRRLLPRPGAGVTCGLDVFGRPNCASGVGLHWSF